MNVLDKNETEETNPGEAQETDNGTRETGHSYREGDVYETRGSFEFRIDNASSEWTQMDSEVHHIGGVSWLLRAIKCIEGGKAFLSCYLCGNSNVRSTLWSCTASFRPVMLSSTPDGHFAKSSSKLDLFNSTSNTWGYKKFRLWEEVIDEKNGFLVNDTITIRAEVQIKECTGIVRKRLSTFDSPSRSTDIVLMVEKKEVHVNKGVLAAHSRFFDAMFYGEFKDSNKKRIALEELVHSEFIDFLKVIHPEEKPVDKMNIDHLLKLGDRFDCPVVIDRCTKYLLSTEEIELSKKFLYADQYKLSEVMEQCLVTLATPQAIYNLSKSKDFDKFSESLCKMLIRRIPRADS